MVCKFFTIRNFFEKYHPKKIGHSLTSLKISHGFADSFTSFPSQSFRTLTSLQELDMTNNQLKTVGDTSFHFLHNLRTVELNDNAIERISKGTFQVSILMIIAGMEKTTSNLMKCEHTLLFHFRVIFIRNSKH